MQLDFNLCVKNLSGEPIKNEAGQDQTLGKLLASSLASTNKGNAMKFYGWAVKLWNCEVIDLDKADQKTLTEFIETEQGITNLGKAQLLAVLDGYRDNG